MSKIYLALGDCNTLGIKECRNNSYVEKFGKKVKTNVLNCGYTMSTTNEGVNFFKKNYTNKCSYISIQYGLVDSWRTFKFSPYVLYYPDNILRKFSRKIIKKYKKICKKIGLNKIIGTKNVISKELYKQNLEMILQNSQKSIVFLIETVPNKDTSRNKSIEEYNKLLKELSLNYSNCVYIEVYDYFLANQDKLYLDDTHINNLGYEYISNLMYNKIYDETK